MAKGKMYIPEDLPDLVDLLISMRLNAPKLKDHTGYMPFVNLDYRFRQLNEGLAFNRSKLGEERYQKLAQMSDQLRALFEADPDSKSGDTAQGRRAIQDMLEIVEQARRKA